MTCKDCVHCNICKAYDDTKYCNQFQNKSDFVNVVRCKDCRYYEPDIERSGYEPDGYCNWFDDGVDGLDFCSYGQRKEDDEE